MKILASERSNNELDTSRLKSLGYDAPDIKTSVRKILETMKNNH